MSYLSHFIFISSTSLYTYIVHAVLILHTLYVFITLTLLSLTYCLTLSSQLFYFKCILIYLSHLDQAEWVGQHLGPALHNISRGHVKIMILDDNRVFLPKWVDEVSVQNLSSFQSLWKWLNSLSISLSLFICQSYPTTYLYHVTFSSIQSSRVHIVFFFWSLATSHKKKFGWSLYSANVLRIHVMSNSEN